MNPGEHSQPEALVRQAADGIARHGIVVIERFLPDRIVSAMRAEAARLQAQGAFRRAGIGAGGDFRTRDDIRGDEIHWIEADGAAACVREALGVFEQLRLAVNRELFLGLFDFECHLARYRPGAGYTRHYDQLRADGRRQLTVTLYLNENWRSADGGALRVYTDDADASRSLDILPTAGTLVAFLSARFAHEVLASKRERLSFTGWFRTR